jgi:hypothetical protein
MKNILQIILITFFTFTISSCAKDSDSPSSATAAGVTSTGSDGTDGTNGKNSLISTTTESSGANCTTGGLKIQSGLDSDEDGVLDSAEVTATTYVCNGSNGSNGSNGIQPAASLYCGAALENTTLLFSYTAMVFSDNSVFVHGSVYGILYEIGASKFYDSSQNGASTAAVIFTYDADATANGGFWKISINRSTLAATIVYTEANVSGANTTTWTLPSSSSNCVLNSY